MFVCHIRMLFVLTKVGIAIPHAFRKHCKLMITPWRSRGSMCRQIAICVFAYLVLANSAQASDTLVQRSAKHAESGRQTPLAVSYQRDASMTNAARQPGTVLTEVEGCEDDASTTDGNAPKAEPTNVDWGALFKMHYQNRVKLFAEQNQVFQNVVLVGDSITEAFDVAKYLPGSRILNRGIGADVIGNALPADDPRGVLKRLDSSIFDCSATDVFLMIGINDLNSGRTPDIMEEGYRELFQRIQQGAPRVRVHVQSVLPTRGSHAARNPAVLDTNKRLKRLAAEFGYDFIDLHALLVDSQGQLKTEYTEDGLHLTPPAYAVWRQEVLRVLGWVDSQR
jgi:lysophospholipase L1-like esterase